MPKYRIVISALVLWCAAIWFYGQLGMSVLVTDSKTGQKYCITPLAEYLGIANTWVKELLFDVSLSAILAVPIALAWYIFRLSRAQKNIP